MVMNTTVTRRKTQKAYYSKHEVSASTFIPYQYHWDRETLMTKKNEMLQIIKLDGFSFETADDEDVDMKKLVRNSLLKSMADGTFAVWFHTIRRRQSAYPGGKQPPGFAAYVDKLWHEKHHSKDSYINELYITIVRKADTKGAAKVHHYLKKASESGNKQAQIDSMRDAQKELSEAVSRLCATFKDYGAKLLTTYENEHVIWNFENEKTINIRYLHGSLLGEDASVTNGSPIEGMLYAENFTGGGELHNFPFLGVDPIGSPIAPGVPEPATWALLGMGFAGLGFVSRRARKTVKA